VQLFRRKSMPRRPHKRFGRYGCRLVVVARFIWSELLVSALQLHGFDAVCGRNLHEVHA